MKQEVAIGQTDYTVLVLMRDDAGAPATALAHTDIDIAYARVETDNDVTTADVTPANLGALTDAHTDWGWEVVSATDHPGLYRLDIADAVFATGAWSAVVTVSGTGLDPSHLEFALVPVLPYTGVNVAMWGAATVATPTVAGVPEVDQTHRLGSAISGAEATVATIADAVWDEAIAGHAAAGSTGEALSAAGAAGPSAATIADAVWDEAAAGHVAAGSTGEALGDAGAGGDPTAIADAVWDEAQSGHVTGGTFGETLARLRRIFQ